MVFICQLYLIKMGWGEKVNFAISTLPIREPWLMNAGLSPASPGESVHLPRRGASKETQWFSRGSDSTTGGKKGFK